MATATEKTDVYHTHKDIAVAADIAAGTDLVTELAKQDTRSWYQKPNLRFLYLMMFPSCMGVEKEELTILRCTLENGADDHDYRTKVNCLLSSVFIVHPGHEREGKNTPQGVGRRHQPQS